MGEVFILNLYNKGEFSTVRIFHMTSQELLVRQAWRKPPIEEGKRANFMREVWFPSP